MKIDWIVVSLQGQIWLKRRQKGRAIRVCTVSEAEKKLGKSKRQIYRYLETGILESCGKYLGEHLIDLQSVERLSRQPLAIQPLPQSMQFLFPEYSLKELNAGRDKILILGRLFEMGSLEDIRWCLRRYSREEVQIFLKDHGSRCLSPRNLRLWSFYFSVKLSEKNWRNSLPNPWEKVFK